MKKQPILIAALSLCFLLTIQTQAESDGNIGVPTITVNKLDMTDKTMVLSYEIRNTSGQDIWILTGGGRAGSTAFIFMDEDDQTLLIQSRLNLPMKYAFFHNVNGRYVLLCPNQIRTESITIIIPVYPEYQFGSARLPRGLEHATRIGIEIGYYVGDLPGMIRDILEQSDIRGREPNSSDEKLIKYYFKGPLQFNKKNEILRERDEEILIPYTDQKLRGERVLRTTVEDLRIPYEEKTH